MTAGDSPRELLAVAREAAFQAGSYLAGRDPYGAREPVAATKSSPADVVTAKDLAAEGIIRACLSAARPDDAFLGEEGGATGSGRIRWIVDPLDGTTNYLHGRPDWAVSVAAEAGGDVVAGAVYAPERGLLFTATAGGGAWLETQGRPRRRLACSTTVLLSEALVSTHLGYDPGRRERQVATLAAIQATLRAIRSGGSAVLELCYVATGQSDAYYESGLQPWDIAAGALIAREAGAATGGMHGAGPGSGMTLACAPGLFRGLRGLLSSTVYG